MKELTLGPQCSPLLSSRASHSFTHAFSIRPPTLLSPPQSKVHRHSYQKTKTKDCRSKLIMIPRRSPMADHVHAPYVQCQTIYQCGARYGGKSPRGRDGDLVMSEIE